jgi:hypothetical protein
MFVPAARPDQPAEGAHRPLLNSSIPEGKRDDGLVRETSAVPVVDVLDARGAKRGREHEEPEVEIADDLMFYRKLVGLEPEAQPHKDKCFFCEPCGVYYEDSETHALTTGHMFSTAPKPLASTQNGAKPSVDKAAMDAPPAQDRVGIPSTNIGYQQLKKLGWDPHDAKSKLGKLIVVPCLSLCFYVVMDVGLDKLTHCVVCGDDGRCVVGGVRRVGSRQLLFFPSSLFR